MPHPIRRAPEAPPLPDGRDVGAHHGARGRFRNPWPPHPDAESRPGGFLSWMWDRFGADLPPNPATDEIPRGTPDPARPRAGPREIRLTLVGHATFLLQVGGLNLLTDPIWTRRAGPYSALGGPRLTGPGMALEALPPLDGVILSHGHYDHLDARTVRMIVDRFGGSLPWYTPLGYAAWLRRRGVREVVELDWWQETRRDGPVGPVRLVCLPARHWTRRALAANRALWASWAVLEPGPDASDAPRAPRGVYFGGDSAYGPSFQEIGERLGPFRAVLLPIGAYAPRWFMAPSHMDPEEAVRAYRDLGGRGAFVGMHWGTFRLSDEHPLEPPLRTKAAWAAAGLPEADLHLPGSGGTVRIEER